VKRWLPFLCVLLAAAAGGATVPESEPPPAEKARRFHRNRELVKVLVDGSLKLAKEDDPIERGGQCADLVSRLEAEVQRAVRDHDGFRTAELGGHLRRLLEHGVAANLIDGKKQEVHPESEGYKRMVGFGRRTLEVGEKLEASFRTLEGDLQQLNDPEQLEELRQALKGLSAGRAEILKCLPKDKDEKPEAIRD
jgi:hypothetical protein